MYQPYDEATASTEDRIAWALCQIIDDDAPLRWTRYRFVALSIATNDKLVEQIVAYHKQLRPTVPKCAGCGTTLNLHRDVGSGGPYRCNSPDCVVF